MKQLSIIFLSISILTICNSAGKTMSNDGLDYTQYVNPFIGTADNGHTFPGACVPFGLIQASPETGRYEWKYCSGYNFEDDSIIGFSQTHLNGTGMADLGDILIMPFAGDAKEHKSSFKEETEKASPGYYAVQLADFDIDVELTATERTAFHRYTFNSDKPARVVMELQSGLGNPKVSKAEVNMPDDKTITGHNTLSAWVNRQVFYAIEFDKPYKVMAELPIEGKELAKKLILEFDIKKGEVLQTKVALSSVSIEGAKVSMEKENPNWYFAEVKKRAENKWNSLLSKVQVTGTEDQKVNFYTSLYHLYIQPNNIADTDGKYRRANDSVYISDGGVYYSTFSLWDTYRAAHPLYTILTPDKVGGFVQSMLAHHRIQGYLPIWTLWGKENHCMIGNHSIPVIVDAYLKGFDGFDAEEAYQAIKISASTRHEKAAPEVYDKYGYYPFDITSVESVSRTLEHTYDDYCIAQMAKALNKSEDYEFYMRRANYYKNLFDSDTKLMRGKDSEGNWRKPFDSFLLSHSGTSGGDYTEGNAWQYTWHVQHNVEGLIDLIGGKEAFVTKLDSLFYLETKAENTGFVHDVTGLIGQYAHGNEPSHHVAYMYNYAGRPDKTQELIREIFDRFYLPKPDGLCGNDDCGQMSAWYVFSSMGFYPVNPCGGEYIIGAPQIETISLQLPHNKTFTVIAQNLSETNKYVESVLLNDKQISDFRIHHKDIINGGTLIFNMTSTNTNK